MEQCIRQNNAIDIYEDYFELVDEATQCERPEAKTVHVFRDPTPSIHKRPISSISWLLNEKYFSFETYKC